MVVFETHHTKKYDMGSGVAPQKRIALHTMGQKRCCLIPEVVVFITHHPKNMLWVPGWGPKQAYLSAHLGPEKVFPDT